MDASAIEDVLSLALVAVVQIFEGRAMKQLSLRSIGLGAWTGPIAALTMAGAVASATAEVTITTWSIRDAGLPEFMAIAIEEFNEIYPDVEVVFEDFPGEAYKTSIQVALVSSDPPDVFFNWVGEDSARLVRDGLVLDITDLGRMEGGFMNTLAPSWIDSITYDGRVYGVPRNGLGKYFFYNRTFFAENGLTPPDDFDGLLQLCRDIRAIDPDIVPAPLGNSERWKLNHYITMFNHRILGAQGIAADYDLSAPADELFTDPGYVEALQRVLDMREAGCWQDAPNATAPDVSRAMFASEQSPMIYCGTWCAGIFDADGFTDYAMFRMPPIAGGRGDPNADFLVTEAYQVSSQTEHPEEAVAWASFLVSADMAARFVENMTMIPSNPDRIDTAEGLTEQFRWIIQDMGTFSEGIGVLDVELENSVSEAYLDAGVAVLNGTITPAEAMERIRNVALEAQAQLAN